MEADRIEMNNLVAQYPDIVKSMERMYEDWAERCDVLPWPK